MTIVKDIIDLLMLRKQEKKLDAEIAVAPLTLPCQTSHLAIRISCWT